MAKSFFALFALSLFSAAPSRAAIRVLTGRDIDIGLERPVAVEFTDARGQLIRKLNLEPRASDDLLGVPDAFDALLSGSGKILVLTHWRPDPMQRNPYAVRRSESTRISWYGEDGTLLGQRDFPARTQVMGVSRNGDSTVIVDAGFQGKDFELFNDVPWIRSTAELAADHELIDHKIYAMRPDGSVALERVVKGPDVPPNHVEVSPSGRWFLFKLDRPDVYVEDVKTRKEDCYARALPLEWRVDDRGELFGYQPQGSGLPRKYVRKPGADQAVLVETASSREP